MSKEKPPLGLRPRQVAASQRLEEIDEAIIRYIGHVRPLNIPREWLEEREELVTYLNKTEDAK
ncbi:hypothetical protein D3C77_739720 [compost metagenome]